MNDTSGVLFWVPDSPTDRFNGKRERERGGGESESAPLWEGYTCPKRTES